MEHRLYGDETYAHYRHFRLDDAPNTDTHHIPYVGSISGRSKIVSRVSCSPMCPDKGLTGWISPAVE